METGEIARQCSAVIVSMGDTQVLATVVGDKNAVEGRDFFPLTVDYQEKGYAAGQIPGNFFRREGRPSEAETLLCRLVDRPLRPLFPKGMRNETQIIITALSSDGEFLPETRVEISVVRLILLELCLGALAAAALWVAVRNRPFVCMIGAILRFIC